MQNISYKKNISISSAEFAHRMVKVKDMYGKR